MSKVFAICCAVAVVCGVVVGSQPPSQPPPGPPTIYVTALEVYSPADCTAPSNPATGNQTAWVNGDWVGQTLVVRGRAENPLTTAPYCGYFVDATIEARPGDFVQPTAGGIDYDTGEFWFEFPGTYIKNGNVYATISGQDGRVNEIAVAMRQPSSTSSTIYTVAARVCVVKFN